MLESIYNMNNKTKEKISILPASKFEMLMYQEMIKDKKKLKKIKKILEVLNEK